MRDDPVNGSPAGSSDPFELARRDLQKNLPRRFYTSVAVAMAEGQYAVMLDGRPVRTPARAPLAVPTRALAEAIAAEWASQAELIDPATMPLTRLVNVAIDGVLREAEAVINEIVKYGESDLLCYRAEGPDKLVKAQAEAWDPVLAKIEARLDARFLCSEGIVFVEQSNRAKAAVHGAVAAIAAQASGHFRLTALQVMTALTGSVLLALALVNGEIAVDEAWKAAHVDEDFEIAQWGEDREAALRRARRFEEMAAAARLWELLETAPA